MTTRKVWAINRPGFLTPEEARKDGVSYLKKKFPKYKIGDFEFPNQYSYIGDNGERLYAMETTGLLVIPQKELDKYAESILSLIENEFISKYTTYDRDGSGWELTMCMSLDSLTRSKNIHVIYKDKRLYIETEAMDLELTESKFCGSIIKNMEERKMV